MARNLVGIDIILGSRVDTMKKGYMIIQIEGLFSLTSYNIAIWTYSNLVFFVIRDC